MEKYLNQNKTVARELTTSSADVYTTPPSFKADVRSIVLTNTAAGDVLTTLKWYDSLLATEYTLAKVYVPGNGFIQITDALFLNRNDKITALAASGSAITAHVSVVEYFSQSI